MHKPSIHLGTMLTIFFAGTGLCHGTAIVNLNTQAYVGGTNSLYQSTYNYTPYPAEAPIYTPTGSSQVNACTAATDCTLDVSTGTRDNTGTATSAFESVAITSVTPADNLGDPAYTARGAAYATGNLATGTLGVAASGDYLNRRFNTDGQDGGTGLAQALLDDVLHFTVAGANASTVTNIGVTYTLNGSISSLALGDSAGTLEAALHFGSGNEDVQIGAGNPSYTPQVTSSNYSNWFSASFTQLTPNQVVFSGIYQLVGATANIGVQTYLTAQCGVGDSCDYSHTAHLTLTDPANVTYTSDSGVFLTQVSSSVPEPATYGVFASGLALLALVHRFNHRPVNRRIA